MLLSCCAVSAFVVWCRSCGGPCLAAVDSKRRYAAAGGGALRVAARKRRLGSRRADYIKGESVGRLGLARATRGRAGPSASSGSRATSRRHRRTMALLRLRCGPVVLACGIGELAAADRRSPLPRPARLRRRSSRGVPTRPAVASAARADSPPTPLGDRRSQRRRDEAGRSVVDSVLCVFDRTAATSASRRELAEMDEARGRS